MTAPRGTPRAVVVSLVLAACLLASCASSGSPSGDVRQGMSVDDVMTRWGQPHAVYQLAAGQRMFYRPFPWQVKSLQFDAEGRLTQIEEQVLTSGHLGRIVAGRWRAADVQQTFGPPARRKADAEQGSVWLYFFREYGAHRLARIHLDKTGMVVRVELVDDPAADDSYL
jgi:hypothetical protein